MLITELKSKEAITSLLTGKDNQPPDTLIGDIRKLDNVTNALLIRRQ